MKHSNLSSSHKRAQKDELMLEQHNIYAGPIPSPEIMKGFADVDPSFPERILKMAEIEGQFRQEETRKNNRVIRAELRSDAIIRFIVPFLTFVIVFAVLYLAYYAFSKNLEWGGAIIGLPGLAMVVAMFTRFSRQKPK